MGVGIIVVTNNIHVKGIKEIKEGTKTGIMNRMIIMSSMVNTV